MSEERKRIVDTSKHENWLVCKNSLLVADLAALCLGWVPGTGRKSWRGTSGDDLARYLSLMRHIVDSVESRKAGTCPGGEVDATSMDAKSDAAENEPYQPKNEWFTEVQKESAFHWVKEHYWDTWGKQYHKPLDPRFGEYLNRIEPSEPALTAPRDTMPWIDAITLFAESMKVTRNATKQYLKRYTDLAKPPFEKRGKGKGAVVVASEFKSWLSEIVSKRTQRVRPSTKTAQCASAQLTVNEGDPGKGMRCATCGKPLGKGWLIRERDEWICPNTDCLRAFRRYPSNSLHVSGRPEG